MEKIQAIVVDDEELGRKNIHLLLGRYCPEIDVKATFEKPLDAKKYIEENTIELVFLDINMPNINGFEFVESFKEPTFDVIYVTAYHDMSLRALRLGAIDYITKPISVVELREAIERFVAKQRKATKEPNENTKISVAHSKGTSILDAKNIVYLQADAYTTTIFLQNKDKLMVSKNIKFFEDMLDSHHFFRLHKSYIVNLNYIDSYSNTDGGFVRMKQYGELPISRRKKDTFLKIIHEFTK